MDMVIGEGVIANRFSDYLLQSKYLIFAGSVNDSAIRDENTIQKEEIAVKVALSSHPDSTFVYFSSCSILDQDVAHTPYVQHKVRMEKLIQGSVKSFLIFRLPQVLGLSDAKSSLVNYLVDAISNQKPFELWENAQKNIIDIDDVHEIVGEALRRKICLNQIINVASTHQTSVLQLVREIEDFMGFAGNYVLVNKGASYELDVSEIKLILSDLNINFDKDYIRTSLSKYFGHLITSPKLLSVIVPTYNEEHGIEEFYRRTKDVLVRLAPRFEHEIIFVNDFSTDNTFQKLKLLAQADPAVKLINFSRNFGNQIGITAGIDFSRGDIAVVIDDDLQDPPEIILNLIAKWDKGYKVVYGVRPKRQGVSPLFKLTAKLYYRLIGSLSDTKIPNDTGDFRLIDRVVIETLKTMKEENRYYRGMVAWVGFPQIGVVYKRDRRYAGISTFSFKKYVNFALNGLTSFTEKPLYFSSLAGLFITTISFILALVLIVSKIIDPSISIRGWTSLTVIILFFGGIQLLSAGILGVYISKIYREVKGRPLYIVESTKNIEQLGND
ncbi:glycosyltransferase [Methylobacter tundripaludum]|uniref:glycosyltransferase n=1 Tax=Methylobacter tundripaludum TaxID=173365 RepID=UPI0009DF3836|nr:glycosyltransferase [Methylobacter tundripaludum]